MGFMERMLKLIGVWDPEESGFTRTCGWCENVATRVVQLTGPQGDELDTAHCNTHHPQGAEYIDQWLDRVGYGARTRRSS